MKFKLVEEFITEDFETHCDKCGKTVLVDSTFECPSCSSNNLLDNVVNDIMDINSEYILFFNEATGMIGKALKSHLGQGHDTPGPNSEIVGVTKGFFDSLPPYHHDRTPINSHLGGFRLTELNGSYRAIVDRLNDFAKPTKEN